MCSGRNRQYSVYSLGYNITLISVIKVTNKIVLTHSSLGFSNGLIQLLIWAIPFIRKKECFTNYTSKMANSIDPDEMAHYEPSHLDLCCLQISVKASLGMNGLKVPTVHN